MEYAYGFIIYDRIHVLIITNNKGSGNNLYHEPHEPREEIERSFCKLLVVTEYYGD